MWKWVLKQAVKALAEPIVDAVILALENLSARTGNTIDDEFVAKFKEFKEAIVGFILSQCDKIAKAA
ncbi:MAG: hypothetical protein KAH23_08390 [Kiritimatiellae bacterium]|nr:hypothetical protein [Kiritimatiellia bacterium]